MIDLNKYDLIKNNENNSYYNIQKDLIVQYRKSGKIDYTKLRPVLFEMPTYQYLRTGDVIGNCMKFNHWNRKGDFENEKNILADYGFYFAAYVYSVQQ